MRPHRVSLLLSLAACTPSATVTPTKDAPSVTSRPENCEIEFFEIDNLQRPFDVLAEVRVTPSPYRADRHHATKDTKEEMRRQACLLGADAVIGLHQALAGGQLPSPTLVGTAVRSRP